MSQATSGRIVIRWSFWLEIDLSALAENLRALKRLLASGVQVLPVVKSEAYGHGLLPVAKTLASEGIYGFGLSDLEEILKLREAGLALPLLLLSGFEPAWLPEILRLKAIPVVTDFYQLKLLADFTRKNGKRCAFHLKIDTGMHRLGLLPQELPAALETIKENPQLRLEGLMSHLACGEEPACQFTRTQRERFEEAIKLVKASGFTPRFFHLANSAATILSAETHYNLIRPGIALYGVYPCPETQKQISLTPVMTAKARILSLKEVEPGGGIGYGPLFQAQKPMKIALVPVGYDDGYPRALSNRGFAWVRGKRARVVGAVSMRLLCLDVSDIPEVKVGDEVILLGGRRREVPAEELAATSGLIPYELLCSLGKGTFKIFLGTK